MIRYLSLHATCVTCLLLFCAQETLAQDNILVDLAEDGTLTIAEEFVAGKTSPYTSVLIETINYETSEPVVSLTPVRCTLNGQNAPLEFDPADIQAIEVTNVNQLMVYSFFHFLVADLAVFGADNVEITGFGYGYGGIVGNTTIVGGLGTNYLTIYNVDLYGDLTVSTGQGSDFVELSREFGNPYRYPIYMPPFWRGWGPVSIMGNLSVNTGQGSDELSFRGELEVEGDVEIQMGQGFDWLFYEENLITNPDSNVSISLGQQ
jgi:hypothetical protein